MAFQNDNRASGLDPNNQFQVGISNTDNDSNIEQGVNIPWSSDPQGSYIYYDCTVGVMLDSGIVVHNRLPQVNRTADSLSSTFLDAPDFAIVTNKGVNLTSKDQYTDIQQRMGHARYWLRIWGQALRAGYQVPIPAIKTIGGVEAIPYDQNPQWAFNRIFPSSNCGGIVIWHAQWSLWYTTLVPPINQIIPTTDPVTHIGATAPQPPKRGGIQAPFSQADDNAQVGGGLSGIVSK